MSGKIGIVGSGYIGRSFAIVFSRAGYDVYMYDKFPEQVDAALKATEGELATLEKQELLNGQTAGGVFARIHKATTLKDALKGAIYVQECIPERLDLKQMIFAELDKEADEDTILASSTSNIPASKFTEELKNRKNCLVSHPVNPPHVVPLIELVPAPWTDKAVVERAKTLLEKCGSAPVVLFKEINGFLVNRLQYAILAESFRLIEDGVCSVSDLDKVVSEGLGRRWSFMGPFQTVDLNHQQGMKELKEVYLPEIDEIWQNQTYRKIKDSTHEKVKESFRNRYDITYINKMVAWRNERLMALARHQTEAKKIDKEAGKK